jgi:hypothetical protein
MNWAMIASIYDLSSTVLVNHPVICHYRVSDTENVVKQMIDSRAHKLCVCVCLRIHKYKHMCMCSSVCESEFIVTSPSVVCPLVKFRSKYS